MPAAKNTALRSGRKRGVKELHEWAVGDLVPVALSIRHPFLLADRTDDATVSRLDRRRHL